VPSDPDEPKQDLGLAVCSSPEYEPLVTLPQAGCAEQSACIRNALGRHCGEAGVPGGPREGSSEGDRLRSDPLNLAGRAR